MRAIMTSVLVVQILVLSENDGVHERLRLFIKVANLDEPQLLEPIFQTISCKDVL